MACDLEKTLKGKFAAAEACGELLVPVDRAERRQCARARASGVLVCPYPGLFARGEWYEALPERVRYLSVVRGIARLHPDWIFCSFTAAILHGLWVANARLDAVHVRVDGRESTRKSPGRIQCHLIVDDEFAMQCGLRVTSLHRTVLDCLCATRFCEGLGIVDAALHWGMTDRGSIVRYAAEHGARRPGIVGARRVLAYADGGSENGGESLARGMMIELGFAVPELQVEFADPMEPGNPKRVDFCWRRSDGRVIVGELDGLAKYSGGERVVDPARAVRVLAKERRREAHLNLTGATVIRFSLAEALDASYFTHLLSSAGVPRAQP